VNDQLSPELNKANKLCRCPNIAIGAHQKLLILEIQSWRLTRRIQQERRSSLNKLPCQRSILPKSRSENQTDKRDTLVAHIRMNMKLFRKLLQPFHINIVRHIVEQIIKTTLSSDEQALSRERTRQIEQTKRQPLLDKEAILCPFEVGTQNMVASHRVVEDSART